MISILTLPFRANTSLRFATQLAWLLDTLTASNAIGNASTAKLATLKHIASAGIIAQQSPKLEASPKTSPKHVASEPQINGGASQEGSNESIDCTDER